MDINQVIKQEVSSEISQQIERSSEEIIRSLVLELRSKSVKPKRYLTIQEAADYMGLSTSTVKKLQYSGELKHIFVTRVLFDMNDIDSYMLSKKTASSVRG